MPRDRSELRTAVELTTSNAHIHGIQLEISTGVFRFLAALLYVGLLFQAEKYLFTFLSGRKAYLPTAF